MPESRLRERLSCQRHRRPAARGLPCAPSVHYCPNLHRPVEIEVQARVGPELTHVASRLTIAAGTLPNTREHLRAWVHDPPALRPGVRMPASPFTDDELDAVIAYLRSLR